ncbi:kinase-like protein [Pholiota conissans]|uniref:Kinase-like protein n=1 Tax=Pholiota conissans TaxID=109636 RepID=A0A9P6CW82_9AGAR|nr:kinase-like protein [Pholiota conissans]
MSDSSTLTATGAHSSEKEVVYDPSIRSASELFWVGIQPFLLSRGYRLRERYQPDWKPSWIADSGKPSKLRALCEDRLSLEGPVMDAVRISDNSRVVLKKVRTAGFEISVSQFLSSPTLRQDPRNHTVPLLDVIPLPTDDDWALLVMPKLLEFQRLPFRRVGEFCEAVLQYLQALEFMHEHNVVHRDVCMTNLAMDISKVIPKGSHMSLWQTHDGVNWADFQWYERWSVRPVQYYLIDFGISLHLPKKDVVTWGVWGRDKTVPEMSSTSRYDPFKVDIYQLGRVFLDIIDKYPRLSRIFLPLAERMTCTNPKDRPTAAEAVKLCQTLISKLSRWTLSRRIWMKTEYHEYGCSPIEHFLVRFCGWNPTYL